MALTEIKTSGIADDAITTDKLANAINTERTANTAKVSLGADAVTGAKIADDAVGAEHIEVLDSHLQLADSCNVKIGTGDDLQIYHDGSHSYLKNSTGRLRIQGDDVRIEKADGSEFLAKFTADGAAELYHDDSKKFETRSGGLGVFGHIEAGDNNKVMLGDANDLQIYHNGSHSYIDDTGTGQLILKSNLVKLQATNGEDYLQATENAAVSLWYNGSKKLETYTDGVLLDGHARPGTTDIHDLGSSTHKWRNIWMENDLYIENNGMLVLGTAEDWKIYNTGSDVISDTSHSWTHKKDGSSFVQFGSSQTFWTKDHKPWSNDAYDLGSSSVKWDDVYATNGSIQTSDKNEKNTIVDTDLGLSFVNKLKPVSYKFNGKTRTHYGLIAQDVETTLSDISKPTTDFAGFIKEDVPEQVYDAIKDEGNIPEGKKAGDVKKDAYTTYGLRYNEFISPLIKAVQELSAEVETLKTEKTKLQTDLTALTARVAALEAG